MGERAQVEQAFQLAIRSVQEKVVGCVVLTLPTEEQSPMRDILQSLPTFSDPSQVGRQFGDWFRQLTQQQQQTLLGAVPEGSRGTVQQLIQQLPTSAPTQRPQDLSAALGYPMALLTALFLGFAATGESLL